MSVFCVMFGWSRLITVYKFSVLLCGPFPGSLARGQAFFGALFFVFFFWSVTVGPSELLDSSTPSWDIRGKKENPRNLPQCYSLGHMVPAGLSFSLHLRECSYVYIIYNIQDF